MNSNDDSAFLNSIKGVKPIIKKNTLEKKIPPKNTKYKNITNPKEKTKQTVKTLTKISKFSNFSIQKSNINKRLKKGKIPIDKKIDFHGLSVLDSEILFFGDASTDYNAAKISNIDFIAINADNYYQDAIHNFNNFKELDKCQLF